MSVSSQRRERWQRRDGLRRGFSLMEVLLAVMILGIGVISIAALFPAGIAQQRQSVDDVIGPIVAQNALSVIRGKVRPEDFGTFEEFDFATPFTIEGDWTWLRPAVHLEPNPNQNDGYSAGTLDIFDDGASTDAFERQFPDTLKGIPYNTSLYSEKPTFVITQGERYYPMGSENIGQARIPRPQYVWDCMFRRFQGRMLVAIFVYRVNIAGGGAVAYTLQANPDDPDEPPLPFRLDVSGDPWDAWGLTDNDRSDDARIYGTAAGGAYVPTNADEAWQQPGQWLLDQNNNMHRTMARIPQTTADRAEIELVRAIPRIFDLPIYSIDRTVGQLGNVNVVGIENIVSDVWYIPHEIDLDIDGDGNFDTSATLTPVYATVREL